MAKKILFEVVATSKGLKVVGKEAQTLTTNTEKLGWPAGPKDN